MTPNTNDTRVVWTGIWTRAVLEKSIVVQCFFEHGSYPYTKRLRANNGRTDGRMDGRIRVTEKHDAFAVYCRQRSAGIKKHSSKTQGLPYGVHRVSLYCMSTECQVTVIYFHFSHVLLIIITASSVVQIYSRRLLCFSSNDFYSRSCMQRATRRHTPVIQT